MRIRRGRSSIDSVLLALPVALLVAALSVAPRPAPVEAAGGPANKVTLQLDFGIDGKHAGIFLAKTKGFFAQQNLDVNIVPGSGAGLALDSLSAGKAQFALSSFINLVLAASKGAQLTSVMSVYDRSPIAIASLKNRLNLRSPKDLEGHSVAVANGTTIQAMLPVLLSVNKVDASKVKVVNTGPTLYIQTLLQGQADSIPSFLNESYLVLKKRAVAVNQPLSVLKFSDWGVDTYDLNVVVTKDLVRANPGLIKRFIAAVVQGQLYMEAHPDEAVAAVLSAAPQLPRDITHGQVEASIGLAQTDRFRTHGYGWTDMSRLQHTINLVSLGYHISQPINAASIGTNSFLPQR